MAKHHVIMLPIQTQESILADLLVIQKANARPPPKKVVVNMRRHKKAQARPGLLNYKHKTPVSGVGRPRSQETKEPKKPVKY